MKQHEQEGHGGLVELVLQFDVIAKVIVVDELIHRAAGLFAPGFPLGIRELRALNRNHGLASEGGLPSRGSLVELAASRFLSIWAAAAETLARSASSCELTCSICCRSGFGRAIVELLQPHAKIVQLGLLCS